MTQVTLIKNEKEGIFIIRHKFNRPLFTAFGKIKGGKYDREAKCWCFSLAHHRKEVWAILKEADIELEIEYTEEDFTKLYPSRQLLQRDEVEILEKTERYFSVRNYSSRTIDSYNNAIIRFLIYFRNTRIEDINGLELDEYFGWLINVKKYSYSTLNVNISGISALYKCIMGKEMLPLKIDRPQKAKKLPKAISKSEVEAMITSQKNLKHKIIIMVIYSCALRRAEIINLELKDIIWEEGKVLIHGKGNKERVCFLSKTLEQQVKKYISLYKPEKYLIEGESGEKYSASSILQVVKKAAKSGGIDRTVTPHMLRHSFATHMLTLGTNVAHIQKILGHANIKTTMIYTHLVDEDLKHIRNPLEDLDIT